MDSDMQTTTTTTEIPSESGIGASATVPTPPVVLQDANSASTTTDPVAATAARVLDAADRVQQVMEERIKHSTRRNYINIIITFILWLLSGAHKELIPDNLVEAVAAVEGDVNKRKCIKEFMKKPEHVAPLKLTELKAYTFIEYLLTLKTTKGKNKGNSLSYGSLLLYRSALSFLYREYRVSMPSDFEKDVHDAYSGLGRRGAKDSDGRAGKEPIDFQLYRALAALFLKSGGKDTIFAHTMFVLSWNLMCRVSNMTNIRFEHLEWKEDALGIFFTHQKNDQMGQKPRDARHVYANPLQPEICPVLALALYWITIPISTSEDKESLFPGNSQDSRYRGILGTLLTEPDGAKVVKDAGLTATQIGCHSTRKGSSTYASSGSTACPPSTAISIRASWTLGGVEGHYLRYEAAGDQYVGRTFTGLPIQSANFAILPPFFKCGVTDEISEAIKVAFPNLPLSCNRVGEFALASLVFHRNWLHSTLPAFLTLHPIFSSRVLDKLSSLNKSLLRQTCDQYLTTYFLSHI